MAGGSDITRVASKVRAFREAHPIDEYAIVTDFTEDVVGDTARVVGHCRIIKLDTGQVVAESYGTRALRAPLPGKQGHQDTRDPDRAMTQATGRALGLCGFADGESLEGDTDEDDETGVTHAPASRRGPPECELCGGLITGPADRTATGYAHKKCPPDIPATERTVEAPF